MQMDMRAGKVPPLKWTVGQVEITALVETDLIADCSFMFPSSTEAELRAIPWLSPHFVTEDWRLKLRIQALLVRTPGLRIIVDTCFGNEKSGRRIGNMLHTDFMDRLLAEGFSPEDVDVVLCTHLHVDHVGWNTKLEDGRWIPTFPNARYLFARPEYDHISTADDPSDSAIYQDSVKPLMDAGLVELVDMDHRLCDEIGLTPTPGHTSGHVSIVISSGGEEALITGDFAHHPAQIARPDWCSLVDAHPEQAAATRKTMWDRLADTGALVIGTHFHAPTVGRVVRTADGYRLASPGG